MFPVCCTTCRKIINPYYEPFRERVRRIGTEQEGLTPAQQSDRVAEVLNDLGIYNICCRIAFLSHVDTLEDDMATRGDLYEGTGLSAGEILGTVTVIRKPLGDSRSKPSILLAR